MKTLLIVSASIILASSWAEDAKKEDPSKKPAPAAVKEDPPLVSKWGPRDVEVQLTDNSLFRGELDAVDTIVLKTAYGTLTIPSQDILRVQRGSRPSEKMLADIADAIKSLDSEEFAKRTAAQYKLESGGEATVEPLKKAREAATPEARGRIDKILAKLNEKFAHKKIQLEDTVTTLKFEISGTLQLNTLKLVSRVGQLSVKMEDLHSIRWLSRGDYKNLTIEPNAAMSTWIDTGINLTNGENVAIVATGTINPSPNNNNLEITPIGTENWGIQNGFMMGTLIGRVGVDGEIFSIGQGKAWTSSGKDRLYVKISWNNRQCRIEPGAKGAYKLKIATGTLSEGIKIPKSTNDENPEQLLEINN